MTSSSSTENLLQVIGYSLLWFGISILVERVAPYPTKILKTKDLKEREKERINYLTQWVSLLHALFILVSCKNPFTFYPKGTWATIIYPFEYARQVFPLETFILKISLGYFLYDSIYGYIKGFNSWVMNLHHAIVCSAMFYPLYVYSYPKCLFFRNYYGTEIIPPLAIAEASNPFLILRTIFEFLEMPE